MIVICPACFCKYSVQAEAIGAEKLVRCTMCGATWQQVTCDKSVEKKRHVFNLVQWLFFWFVVFITILSLFFAKNTAVKFWPAVAYFYNAIGIQGGLSCKAFSIKNISNFFVMKNGVLYMGLKGELINTSNKVQNLPSIVISLKNDSDKDPPYMKIWTHDLVYKKLLPNQKVVFETELQRVPYDNLICNIKLNVL